MWALGFLTLLHALGAKAAPYGQQTGELVHCVNGRAHSLNYEVSGEENDGSSMEPIESAVISFVPSDKEEHIQHCLGEPGETPAGSKKFCYGVNQDASCEGAKAVLPIQKGFNCKDCYISASAEAIYKLNYSNVHLHHLEVGVVNAELRASMSIEKDVERSGSTASGAVVLPGSNYEHTIIDTMVGCPVCVRVHLAIKLPSEIQYQVLAKANVDLDGGALMTASLGDNYIRYDSGEGGEEGGWQIKHTEPSLKVTPILSADPSAEATLDLKGVTSFQIFLNQIAWYHLDMIPAMPLKLKEHGIPGKDATVCLDGDASFTVQHEADLDWRFLKWHAKSHFGPRQLFSWSKPGMVHKCNKEPTVKLNTTDIMI